MIHVICIKFGKKYSSEYVNKLFRGISRNTSKEFLFTCFTDNEKRIAKDIRCQPLPYRASDWHSKIGLYNKDLYIPLDQVFYFDLDTVITGNLDDIFEYEGNFICLRDFYRKDGFGSGLMSWRPNHANFLWKNYTHGYRCRYGDQGWLEENRKKLQPDIWQELYPKKIISYKVHIKDKGKIKQPHYTNYPGSLDTASIVCFHGKPLPHEVKSDWMIKHWTG